MTEPQITINGHQLSFGQSMALRVAATNMLSEMSNHGALGNDDDGAQIVAAYHARLTEIINLMLGAR